MDTEGDRVEIQFSNWDTEKMDSQLQATSCQVRARLSLIQNSISIGLGFLIPLLPLQPPSFRLSQNLEKELNLKVAKVTDNLVWRLEGQGTRQALFTLAPNSAKYFQRYKGTQAYELSKEGERELCFLPIIPYCKINCCRNRC